MGSSRHALVRWTGRGSIADLRESVARVLGGSGMKVSVTVKGGCLLVRGSDSVGVASLVRQTPGVAWVAVGFAVGTFKELGTASGSVARAYLRPRTRFAVQAEAVGKVAAGDVGGVVTSAALEAVKGARTDEARPAVEFRAVFGESGGAVGVELAEGPGGVPTSKEQVVCFVSGGEHSSVVCWMAALSGFRVKMVHAKEDEESVLAVARLYSELSHRVGPTALALEVLEGGEAAPLLLWEASKGKGPIFAGFHAGCSSVPARLGKAVDAPLFLLPEESFAREFARLSVKARNQRLDWTRPASAAAKRLKFSGKAADVNTVIDGLA